eukprot:gene7003-19455_t
MLAEYIESHQTAVTTTGDQTTPPSDGRRSATPPQDVWHGSGANVSASRPRRALGVHLIRRDLAMRTRPPPDYIYRGCAPRSLPFRAPHFPWGWVWGTHSMGERGARPRRGRYAIRDGSEEVSEQFFPATGG